MHILFSVDQHTLFFGQTWGVMHFGVAGKPSGTKMQKTQIWKVSLIVDMDYKYRV